jgi:Salmonella virulence plasmid 65kDa B protein
MLNSHTKEGESENSEKTRFSPPAISLPRGWGPRAFDRSLDGKDYKVQQYRPRIEGLFARIERWVDKGDPANAFWRSISKDNVTTWYGKSEESRIEDPLDPTRVFTWLICESHDDKGNAIVYQYKKEDSSGIDLAQTHERNRTDKDRAANRYLKRIKYCNRTP